RCGLWEAEGFKIDTGPSVLTMTGILSDVFAAAGADMADHLTLHPVDPMYRATFPESVGGEMRVRHGRPAMTEEIRRECGAKEAEALDLVRLGGFRKLATVVQSYFDDPRLVQLFSFQSLYAGLSPFDALAVYSVITYMDTVEGVFAPQGGMHAISRGLAAAAGNAGVSFRYGAEVDRVVRRAGTSGPAIGVRLADGELVRADAVVLNPDLPVAYRTLLPEVPVPRKVRRGEFSPSCALWLAGVRGAAPEGAAHHNIHFGDYDSAFEALIGNGDLQPDPSILVSLQNHTDPSLAPEGCTTIYALEPTPHLGGRPDWTFERDRVRERLIRQVASHGYPVDDVVVERFLDPMDWERLGMEKGAPFALSHRFLQTGPFRPGNVDKRIPGVVFVGSGTQPGVGVPIVLLSGRLAAERVNELREVRA
ncbi:MAG: phytoene desaturase family protein, partial [Acidimicrobiales bacterium]